jgi:hypothetical protein
MAAANFFDHLSHGIDGFVDRNPGVLGVVAATAAQSLVDVGHGVYGILSGHGAEVADWYDHRVAQTHDGNGSPGTLSPKAGEN